jgi:transposase
VLGSVSRWVATNDLVSAELWEAAQPLLPPEPCTTHGGPPRVPHRSALAGSLFVLRHGLRWRDLPQELGYGSGVTCWRRLRQWQAQGVWRQVHQIVLNWLGDLDAIDWSRRRPGQHQHPSQTGWRAHRSPNPTDRAKAGSKYHCENGASVTVGMTRSITGSPERDALSARSVCPPPSALRDRLDAGLIRSLSTQQV